MTTTRTILITGGAGFIGSNLARSLTAAGHKVYVLDTLSAQVHGDDPEKTSATFRSLPAEVVFIKGDVCDRKVMEHTLTSLPIDSIVHLAAETGTGQSMYQIERYTHVNISGTSILLDILTNSRHKVKRFVVASSRSIYGEGKYKSATQGIVYPVARLAEDMNAGKFGVSWNGDFNLTILPTDEDSKIHPSSVYGITKQVQEQLVMTVCPTIGIAPVALRYQNVYGPGQSLSNPYTGILSTFSTRILSGQPINIFEDGRESRDFVFVDDVVAATQLAVECEEASGRVYNVGSGVATSVLEVVEALLTNYGRNVPVQVSGNYRLGDIRHNFADISRISNELGFACKVDFHEGIRRFAQWVMTQHIPKDRYDESLAEMKDKGLLK